MSPQHPSDHTAPRESSIPVAGAMLRYREVGQGQPLIVLHGGPSFDHRYLLPDLDLLADTFRLIYYDQRGRGGSAGGVRPEDVSLRSDLDDLDVVRASFGLDRVAVLGHSWGGLLAMEYTLRHPEHVSHLILLNTAPASYDDFRLFVQNLNARPPADAELLRSLRSHLEADESDPHARAAYYHAYFRMTLRPPELLDRLIANMRLGWTEQGVHTAEAIGDRLWAETAEAPDFDLLPRLAALRVPTLVLHGDYDFIPLACAAHIAKAIPGASLIVLPDCGHFSYMEHPEGVRAALAQFFRTA